MGNAGFISSAVGPRINVSSLNFTGSSSYITTCRSLCATIVKSESQSPDCPFGLHSVMVVFTYRFAGERERERESFSSFSSQKFPAQPKIRKGEAKTAAASCTPETSGFRV